MEWDDFQLILAIARGGTLAGAARALNIDQTTVSRRLKTLEETLNTVLFLRNSRALKPTEAGLTALVHAERMETHALAFADGVESVEMSPHGVVRISTMPWIINHMLMPFLPAFAERFPDIEIAMLAGMRERSLTNRETEISLRFELQARGRELCDDIAVFGYALYAKAGLDAEALRWVIFGEDAAHFAPDKWTDEQRGNAEPIVMRANDAGILHRAISGGLGKGLIPEILAANDPALVRLSGPEPEIKRTLRLIVHPDVRPLARVAAVVEWLHQVVFVEHRGGIAT